MTRAACLHMSEIRIPNELEERLREQARHEGVDLQHLVRDALTRYLEEGGPHASQGIPRRPGQPGSESRTDPIFPGQPHQEQEQRRQSQSQGGGGEVLRARGAPNIQGGDPLPRSEAGARETIRNAYVQMGTGSAGAASRPTRGDVNPDVPPQGQRSNRGNPDAPLSGEIAAPHKKHGDPIDDQSAEQQPKRDNPQDRRAQAESQQDQMPGNTDIDSNRTESDGEDFNPGGRPRPRTEATGEDF